MAEPTRLAEIRARLVNATEGPWQVYSRDVDGRDGSFLGHEIEGPPGADRGQFARKADAAFIAHSPEDVAWLLGVAEAATALQDALWVYERASAHDPSLVETARAALVTALGWTPPQ